MLINLRNALMAGKRLPYDAEVEYLESTGTQWFDTGFKASGGCIVEYKFIQGIISDRGYLFGSHNPPNNSTNDWNRNQSGILNNTLLAFNKCEKLAYIRMGNINTANFHVIKFDARQTLLRGWFDESLVVDDVTTGVLDPVSNIVGFYSPYYQTIAKGSLAWAKIWDVNEFLVRDLIPVRVGTTGYMYDRVSGKLFGNAGTGDFVVGQDVVPVEYIESHGTEFIDTEVNLASGDVGSISVDGQFTNNTKNEQFNGIYAGFYFGAVNYSNTGPKWSVGGTQVGTSDMSRHTFTLTGEIGASKTIRLAVDGSTFTNTRNVAAGKIGLFNIQGQDYYSYMKMWGSSISVNDIPVRKYLPVRVGTGSTWEGAMMDVLTRRIYRNAGTGAFGYGNDLKYPIPAE